MRWLDILIAAGITMLAGSGCALMAPVPTPPASPSPTATRQAVLPTPTPLATPTRVPNTPTTSSENPPGPDGLAMLVLIRPQSGQRVRSPLAIEGTAITFEGVVNVALRDPQGRLLREGTAVATRGAPERGTFALSLTFAAPASEMPGTFEVVIPSPRDGGVLHRLRVPVVLAP